MNKERLLHLAEVIERAPHERGKWAESGYFAPLTAFTMELWHCGSVGCIGGWACKLFNDGNVVGTEEVAPLLGLSFETANTLFYPPNRLDYSSITPAQAATVIRHLVETGEVDWTIIEGER